MASGIFSITPLATSVADFPMSCKLNDSIGMENLYTTNNINKNNFISLLCSVCPFVRSYFLFGNQNTDRYFINLHGDSAMFTKQQFPQNCF